MKLQNIYGRETNKESIGIFSKKNKKSCLIMLEKISKVLCNDRYKSEVSLISCIIYSFYYWINKFYYLIKEKMMKFINLTVKNTFVYGALLLYLCELEMTCNDFDRLRL
jgi:hypothetical protein